MRDVWFLYWIDTQSCRLNKVKTGPSWIETKPSSIFGIMVHCSQKQHVLKNIRGLGYCLPLILVDCSGFLHLWYIFMHVSFYIIVCAFLADKSLLNHRIASEPTVAWLHIIGLLKLHRAKPSLRGSTPKESKGVLGCICQWYDNLACGWTHCAWTE